MTCHKKCCECERLGAIGIHIFKMDADPVALFKYVLECMCVDAFAKDGEDIVRTPIVCCDIGQHFDRIVWRIHWKYGIGNGDDEVQPCTVVNEEPNVHVPQYQTSLT